MAIVSVLKAPHPMLRTVTKEISRVDAKLLATIRDLGDTLTAAADPPGVGLAAPQINRNFRVFATYLEDTKHPQPFLRFFINPKIVDASEKMTVGVNPREPDLEGCLSIPDLYGPVARPEWVMLTWQEITDSHELSPWHTETFFDFAGRVVQHELDHLNGILFTDHTRSQGQPLFQQDGEKLFPIDPILTVGY